jgi:TetR/AcrR family transcriptional repressor of nem operon
MSLRTALITAEARGQLGSAVDVDAAAELLALLAYGVNLRSRAGADAQTLNRTVTATLASIGDRAS